MLQIKQKNAGSRPEWLVEKRYTFGTGVENNYKVSGKDVQAIQAGLEVNGDSVMLFNLAGGESVKLNGEVLEQRSEVKAGDVFAVGDAEYYIEDPKLKRGQAKPIPPSRGWMLKAQNTALANKTFELKGSKIIGRSNDCDICLNVVHLSRNHARITVSGNEVELEDLNSSNGTYVNGEKIIVTQLHDGDEITFDTLKFTVVGPQSSLEKTQKRMQDDGDATTVRPAISASAMAKMANNQKAQKKEKPAATAPNSEADKVVLSSAVDAAETNDSGEKSGVITMAIIGVAILLLAAYLVFA